MGGFIVAFIREWRLTLLLLGITPVVAISGIAAAKVIVVQSNSMLNYVMINKMY